MKPSDSVDAANIALMLLDHAHRAMLAARVLAEREGLDQLADDLRVLCDAVELEAEALFETWTRAFFAD